MNKKFRYAYVCGVDFQHEIGEASDIILYASVEELKKARKCWKECGIVKLKITIDKWIEEQNI